MGDKMSLKLKIVILIFRAVPLAVRRAVFSGLAGLAYHLSLKHRLIALYNLISSFPKKPIDEIVDIARVSYKNFALIFAEFPEILCLDRNNIGKWVSVRGLEHYESALREGRGVVLITAHFGNWEMGLAAMALLSRPPTFVARTLDSAILEEGSIYIRSTVGIGIIHKENAMRPMLRLLKQGGAVKMLIDQNVAADEGVFINFFGRPACATPGVALMAMRSGAAVLPVFTSRMPDGTYLTEIGPKVETIHTGDRRRDVATNTQNYATIIENHIRKYPEQWLWIHQRWKTKTSQARIVTGG